jgi:hypothetical protein
VARFDQRGPNFAFDDAPHHRFQLAGGKLMTINVHREGARSLGASKVIDKARIRVEFGAVGLVFTSNPKGAKDSRFELYVSPSSFRDMAEAMMQANATEAIKAFGAALESGIPEPCEVWYPGIDKDN